MILNGLLVGILVFQTQLIFVYAEESTTAASQKNDTGEVKNLLGQLNQFAKKNRALSKAEKKISEGMIAAAAQATEPTDNAVETPPADLSVPSSDEPSSVEPTEEPTDDAVEAPPADFFAPLSDEPPAVEPTEPSEDAVTTPSPGVRTLSDEELSADGQIEPMEDEAKAPQPDLSVPTTDTKPAVAVEDEEVEALKKLRSKEQSASAAKDAASTEKTPEKTAVIDTDDIKQQTLETIQKDLKIDAAFKEAKDVPPPAAQPEQGAMEEAEKPPAILTPEEIIRGVIQEDLASKKIDLEFEDASLADIILTLGAAAQLNIVLDPMLKSNKLDLHLKNVSIIEALLLIANSYDLGFKRVEKSLFITPNAKLREQNMVSKVIKLKNIGVEEAKLLIKDVIQTVSVSEEINSLIVVGSPEQVLNAENIIKRIDKPQPQVVLEAKIIEVNRDALKDIGVDWSDQIDIGYQESNRPADFDNVEDSPANPFKIFSISRNPIQFNTVIKMLENQNKAKVLSNPRVTTLNNKEAQIFVGDRIPYTITNVTGGVVTTDVRWVEPGIRLIITPTIIEKDFVVLKVEPEVSFIFTFRGPNNEFPHVKTREATAYVRVKNNEPFVLGGLLNQEDKKNLYKVPFLGKLPLLGNLFSYEKKSALDTELIITVIPVIVQSDK